MASHNEPIKGFISGGFGGFCALLVGHPLDTVKVRLQTMTAPVQGQMPAYSGMVDCISKTIRKEGFLGLYRGMGAPFVSVVPVFACCFFGYNLGTKAIMAHHEEGYKLKKHEVFGAGMFAGIFTSAIMAPSERIKCLLQVQAASKAAATYKGPVDAVQQLYKRGGLRNIFVGSGATLLREIPSSGVFFISNETIRDCFRSWNENEELTILQILVSGGVAGICNWIVALPPDVLKSRLQTAPEGKYKNGIRCVFKEMMLKEGVLGLYRGAVPVMIRTFPTAGSCFVGYELCMRFLNMF